ncbi:MAG: 16S rRNA (cytosine(1402)-N(4))-methyltransferase RsmH [Candidatus Levyibacteriota bacterium]
MNNYHTPVLLKEIVDFLGVSKGKKYIDATLGGGGHTFEILKCGGTVLGIDVDQDAIDYVKSKINEEKLVLVKGNFKDIDKIAHSKGFNNVSGIIFDLGVSSFQLEKDSRGFSFQKEGPLDMRMDPSGASGQVKAADLINALTKGELYELFTKLGEERFARTISNDICRARRVKPIETTSELAGIIRKRGFLKKIDPATRVFQALRIAVNDELNNLKEALPKAIGLLEKGGLLEVISFHSLEDRIVKNCFQQFQKEGLGNVLIKKPIVPSNEEQKINRRSRSAKLRVFKRN